MLFKPFKFRTVTAIITLLTLANYVFVSFVSEKLP